MDEIFPLAELFNLSKHPVKMKDDWIWQMYLPKSSNKGTI